MRPDASAPPCSPSRFTARGAARWALLGAVALGAALITLGPDALGRGLGALRRHVSPAVAPGGAAAPSDTQAVYGPKRFDTPTGSSTYHVERFAVAVGPGKRYTLQVDNGGVTGGSVILNGSTVLSSSDLGSGAARWTRVVQALAEDTIQVTVQGPAGAAVTVSVLAASDPTFLVFGPERFTRSTSAPVTDTRHFSISATAAAPYSMCVVNGNADGTQRIASATIVLNGVTVLSQGELSQQVGGLVKSVTLLRENTVDVTLTAKPNGFLDLCFRATDVTPPVITINQPPAGFITREPQVTVAGSVQDETRTTLTVNTNPTTVGSDGSFSATVALTTEGSTDIHVVATDAAQHSTDSTRTVIHDTQPPVLTLNAPADRLITKETSVTVSGTVTDLTPVTVNVNGIPLPVDGAGQFTGTIALSEGANVLTVTATDAAGNATSAVRIVTRDTQPPVLTLTAPTDGATVTTETVDVHGTATDATTAVTVTVNGNPATVGSDGSFSATVALAVGPNTITAVATDAAGNSTTVTRSVTRTSSGLPPDPSTVATPIDATVATTVAASTAFLYGGPNPVQTDVTPGAITPVRAAVLRGRVLTRDGRPLPGARITILGHPEYGQTLSRDDGMFDLAVNGGGVLTVTYGKSGFLSAQRPVDVPWQDYVLVDDAVLVAADAQATVIDFAQPAEIARGSVVSDQDGTRQATLIFPQGTQARLVMPDGTSQPVGSITVRATEYTVGPDGPGAMPAPLPPTSAYTYAVELSADEAIAAGAQRVDFDQAVPFYVENFLNFPVGTIVPVGYYDSDRGAWVPSKNGRVIKVLDTSGGIAQLDADGDGVADDASALAALGVTDAERQRLAQTYQPGQTLWRSPITHFSPWDTNYPSALPSDAQPPDPQPITSGGGGGGGGGGAGTPPRRPPRHAVNDDEEEPSECKGSILECDNQTLGERLPVSGTPFFLNYRSSRVPGRVVANRMVIPLSGDSVPPSLGFIRLRIEIAGRVFEDSFPAAPNQEKLFVWDGKDAYGRLVQGAQIATVSIGYSYPGTYRQPAPADPSFGQTGGAALGGTGTRVQNTLKLVQRVMLGAWDARAAGLGGWTLNAQHAYNPVSRVLFAGDGTRRSAQTIGQSIVTVAGTGINGFSGDGGPAVKATMRGPNGVTATADGSLYFADSFNWRVRRVSPDGIITTVAGNGTRGSAGDGGPAVNAELNGPADVAVAPDGTMYISEFFGHRVRRVSPDGIITTFAGTGTAGFTGDGGPAAAAQVNNPFGVSVARDGSVYIADYGNSRIRRVGPDGVITTVAGGGPPGLLGDSLPAVQATLVQPPFAAVGPDGQLYIADAGHKRIRRVRSDGIITTIAGTGGCCYDGDGGPAVAAKLSGPFWVAFGADGSLFIADFNNERVRRVGPDGIISTLVGNGDFRSSGDGGPPLSAGIDPGTIVVGADGALYIGDVAGSRVRRVGPALPGFAASDILIPSEDGREIYRFGPDGRHLTTLDALTRAERYRFAYDAMGRLQSVTDAAGVTTTVERSADGAPVIVAPFGQRTTLSLDTHGFLTRLENSAGEATQLAYADSGGLLVSMTDPRQHEFRFTHDTLGRLIREEDPAGGFTALTNQSDSVALRILRATALGQTTRYETAIGPDGVTRKTVQDARGLTTVTTVDAAGTVTTTEADGTVKTLQTAPDPRFGMQAALVKVRSVRTPSGLQSSVAVTRHVTLANPDDPLSVASVLDTLAINGRPYTTLFDRAQLLTTKTSPAGRTTLVTQDAVGRTVRSEMTGLAAKLYSYDGQGRLLDVTQGDRTVHFGYDPEGRLGSITDAAGRTRRFFRDAVGRLTRLDLEDGRTVQYSYDANGNVTSVSPPGRPAHTFDYSAVDVMTEYTPPPLGADPAATQLRYNADQQIVETDRPDGTVVAWDYDPAGRLSQVRLPTGTIGYAYDPATGNLASVTAPDGGRVSYQYDGDLPTRAAWSGAVAGSVEVTYGSDFQVASQTVNGAMPITFGRDRDGLLTAAGALTITRSAQHGLIVGATLGAVVTTQAFNPYGEVVDLDAEINGTSGLHTVYQRDRLGRALSVQETAQGVQTTYDYTYDLAGRLTEVKRDGAPIQSYQYDDNGNRLSLVTPSGAVTGVYDARDRVIQYGDAQFTYTANGEVATKLVGGATTRYEYDALGNLTRVTLPSGTAIDYVLDGQSRRIGKRVGGLLVQGFLYSDRLRITAELDGSGQLVSRFVYGTRPNVPDYVIKGGRTYRILADQVGSVRLVIDVETGDVVQRIDYDAFGEATLNTNPGFQPFGFAGGLYDGATGLTHFGAREYDAHLGRWTSSDPALFTGGSANLYSYVLADPVNLLDVNGRGFGDFLRSVVGDFQVGFHVEVGFGLDFKFEFQIGTEGVGIGAGIGIGVKADIGFDVPWHDKFQSIGPDGHPRTDVDAGVDADRKLGEFGSKHNPSPTGEESSCSVEFEVNAGPLRAKLGHDFECGDFGSLELTTDLGLGASETVGCKSFTHW